MFFNQFEIIPIVAETKSFSKASKLLHISQPAISSRIQAMEGYYGAKFFNRTSQGVTLTEAGKVVCAYSVRYLNLHNSMELELDNLLNIDNLCLTIGASCTVGNYAMPCSIRAFKEKYSKVSIKLDIGNTQETLVKLNKSQVDVAVVEGKVEHPNYVSHHIDTANLILVVPCNDRKMKRKVISLKELITKPFILREKGAAMRRVFENALLEHGYNIKDFNIISEMTSIHSVKAAVEGGLGASIVPAIAVEKELNAGTLRAIRIKEFESTLDLDINLIYLKQEALSIITQKFISFMGNSVNGGFCWNLKRMV